MTENVCDDVKVSRVQFLVFLGVHSEGLAAVSYISIHMFMLLPDCVWGRRDRFGYNFCEGEGFVGVITPTNPSPSQKLYPNRSRLPQTQSGNSINIWMEMYDTAAKPSL